jgi:hypothetical protein
VRVEDDAVHPAADLEQLVLGGLERFRGAAQVLRPRPLDALDDHLDRQLREAHIGVGPLPRPGFVCPWSVLR